MWRSVQTASWVAIAQHMGQAGVRDRVFVILPNTYFRSTRRSVDVCSLLFFVRLLTAYGSLLPSVRMSLRTVKACKQYRLFANGVQLGCSSSTGYQHSYFRESSFQVSDLRVNNKTPSLERIQLPRTHPRPPMQTSCILTSVP